MKKKVIGFVHTHWDREWYREFEAFRLRLVRVIDNVLDMLSSGRLPVFYFDGQTSALEDYLELRPEKESQIKSLIEAEKLYIGPMYCSIDEFLSSKSVMEKNLELGLEYSHKFGCKKFLGYFSDTFGHTANVIPILKKYGINTAVVWRGCGEIPSEFIWSNGKEEINCVNLIRGYFNDFFHIDTDIEKRTELIKNNLDKIAEYSGDTLLMPIGGDHLGVPTNLPEIVEEVNKRLEDYEIVLGSIFDYIDEVKGSFSQYTHKGELRDCSKTFLLQGSYSSRLDLKRMNIESTYLLEKVSKIGEKKVIDYAYKLLLQNQAHDSIYGCSLDDVHKECIIRYKKINQICNDILNQWKFNSLAEKELRNFGEDYSGTIEFKSTEKLDGYQLIKTDYGFDPKLLNNILCVPVTEDWSEIYTYLAEVNVKKDETVKIEPLTGKTDVFVTDKCIGNSNIMLRINDDEINIANYRMWFLDTKDCGDSYNEGVVAENGIKGKILSHKKLYEDIIRSAFEIQVECGDILNIVVELDNYSKYLTFKINWENTYTNHKLSVIIDTDSEIAETYSEDLNTIVRRKFDPNYNIRENLPKAKGKEAKTNTAPIQRGVWANNIGIVTKGLTQYEVFKSELRIPILRSTDILSNPQNPVRTTPAGPPYPLKELRQLGKNSVEFYVFLGDKNMLNETINHVYNLIL